MVAIFKSINALKKFALFCFLVAFAQQPCRADWTWFFKLPPFNPKPWPACYREINMLYVAPIYCWTPDNSEAASDSSAATWLIDGGHFKTISNIYGNGGECHVRIRVSGNAPTDKSYSEVFDCDLQYGSTAFNNGIGGH